MENIQKIFYDQFGLNAGYVSDLYEKYTENHEHVSGYWQNYFQSLKNIKASVEIFSKDEVIKNAENSYPEDLEPISGVASKIIENMESSLTIPSATSFRSISVKLMEENRRIINYHLERRNEQKISYSHIVAYAIVKSLRNYPLLNYSYEN